MSFDDVDKYFGTDDVSKGYEALKPRYDGGERSVDLLWRLAKFCREMSERTTDKGQQQKLVAEGQKYALEAFDIDSNNFFAAKWAAVMTGRLTDFLGTKEKIEQGYKFKEYLDKALAIDGKENSLLHMRGRYAFSVASLSWMERKAASMFYATPPTATFEEALADFLGAYDVQPDWIENLMYIARCYVQKSEKSNAKKYLEEALKLEATTDSEKELIKEAQKTLAKC